MDSALSAGEQFLPFEQLGPDTHLTLEKTSTGNSAMAPIDH